MRLRFSSCATSLIITRKAATAQLGVCQTEDLRVSSSAPALQRAPVGAAPDFQRAHCPCNLSGTNVNFVVDDSFSAFSLVCIDTQANGVNAKTVDGLQKDLAPLRESLVTYSVLKSKHRRPPVAHRESE